MNFYNWFFLSEGRKPEGLFSFAHLFTVTLVLVALVGVAIFLGLKFKNNKKAINKVLLISSIIMISLYALRVWDTFFVHFAIKQIDVSTAKGFNLLVEDILISFPFFLCDLAIFIIPLITFTKGKLREVFADFLGIWGIPMGVIGTYLAGNIFPYVSVISFDGLVAIFIHIIPAAVTVFLYITKIITFKKENMLLNIGLFMLFMFFVMMFDNIFYPTYPSVNFMFFMHGAGTPFDLFKPLFKGKLNSYQFFVFIMYSAYMLLFYECVHLIRKIANKKN